MISLSGKDSPKDCSYKDCISPGYKHHAFLTFLWLASLVHFAEGPWTCQLLVDDTPDAAWALVHRQLSWLRHLATLFSSRWFLLAQKHWSRWFSDLFCNALGALNHTVRGITWCTLLSGCKPSSLAAAYRRTKSASNGFWHDTAVLRAFPTSSRWKTCILRFKLSSHKYINIFF